MNKLRSTNKEQYSSRRSDIIQKFEEIIVGPMKKDEILSRKTNPMSLYLTGKLVPFGSTVEVVNEEEFEIQTNELIETESVDELLMNQNPFRASSMGYSFRLNKLTPINVRVSWGMYDEENYQRKQIDFTLDGIIPETKEWKLDDPGILRCKVKERNGVFHVSFYLLNGYKRDNYPLQSEVMFQTKISIEVEQEAVLKFSSQADRWNLEEELLYRHVNEYAIGHGVGVDYQIKDDKCVLETTWLPHAEIPIVDHRTITGLNTSMMDLANMTKNELKDNLFLIVNSYNQWVDEQKIRFNDVPQHLHKIANKNLQNIKRIIKRIENGIYAVVTYEKNYQAFQFANKVMAIQQGQSKSSLTFRSSGKKLEPKYDGSWRLFQLAFILMNIDGVSEPSHDDRNLVDLLWFPTGGGKTEAYLGVAAYLMALRRLNGVPYQRETYAGVTIFMRYTLRLLTTQQFQRATTMICAAEFLRQANPNKWGIEPFSIGLWIGQDSTPNYIEDAKEKIQSIKDGNEVKKGNPMQLQHCPWCGTELTCHDYHFGEHSQRIMCSNNECYFSSNGGIPAYTVDEVIYNFVPTLLIGTVDKIAQIGWNKRFCELFGMKTHYDPLGM